MKVQWLRLAVGNDWLSTPEKALKGVFQAMGSPVPWPDSLSWASAIYWALIFAALGALVYGLAQAALEHFGKQEQRSTGPSLVPSAAWVLGAAWLWDTKPEVWFTYYLHEALITFAGIAALGARLKVPAGRTDRLRWALSGAAVLGALGLTGIFAGADTSILKEISEDPSWRWNTYRAFVDCIDDRLIDVEQGKPPGTTFSVWDPTFPDVTVELSRRHPNWDLTRTNDFYTRNNLAILHGKTVDAVVVPEIWGIDRTPPPRAGRDLP